MSPLGLASPPPGWNQCIPFCQYLDIHFVMLFFVGHSKPEFECEPFRHDKRGVVISIDNTYHLVVNHISIAEWPTTDDDDTDPCHALVIQFAFIKALFQLVL